MFPSSYHIQTFTLSSVNHIEHTQMKFDFENLWLNTLRWVVGHFKKYVYLRMIGQVLYNCSFVILRTKMFFHDLSDTMLY